MKIPAELDFFYPGKGVSDIQMATFVSDLYTKLQNITEDSAPCILSGAKVSTQDNKAFSCGYGSFRFKNAEINGQTMPVFGISEVSTVTVPEFSTGFLVARYTVSNTAPNLPTYFFPVQYVFTPTVNPNTDVAIAYLVNGILQKTSDLVKKYINRAIEPIDAYQGISNTEALTAQQLSRSFAQQSKDLILQGTGYYTLPGYASGLYATPESNPCPKRMHIYGHLNSLQTVSPKGVLQVNLDSSLPVLTRNILHVLPSGVCSVHPVNGQPSYQCGIFTLSDTYSKNGFNLFPIQPFNGDATYVYHGSYTALAYSPL